MRPLLRPSAAPLFAGSTHGYRLGASDNRGEPIPGLLPATPGKECAVEDGDRSLSDFDEEQICQKQKHKKYKYYATLTDRSIRLKSSTTWSAQR